MGKTVVIVDDHAVFRDAARALLEEDGFEVVGEAPDGRSALATVAELRPDVVLLDIGLPDMLGTEVAQDLTADPGGPVVVLCSSRERDDFANAIERCGARAFIPKYELSGAALAAAIAERPGPQ